MMRYMVAVLALMLSTPLAGQQARALTNSPEVACERKSDALKLARLLSDTARVARNSYYQHAREWVLEGRCVQLQSGRWVTVSEEDADSGLVRITPVYPMKSEPDTVWARREALIEPSRSGG